MNGLQIVPGQTFCARPRLPLIVTHPARKTSATQPHPNGALAVLKNTADAIRGQALIDSDSLPNAMILPAQARFSWNKQPSVAVQVQGSEIHCGGKSSVSCNKRPCTSGSNHKPSYTANPQIPHTVDEDCIPPVRGNTYILAEDVDCFFN